MPGAAFPRRWGVLPSRGVGFRVCSWLYGDHWGLDQKPGRIVSPTLSRRTLPWRGLPLHHVPAEGQEGGLDTSLRGGVMQTRWELGCGEGGHIAGDATRSQRAEGLGVPPNCPGNAVPGPSPECGVRRGVQTTSRAQTADLRGGKFRRLIAGRARLRASIAAATACKMLRGKKSLQHLGFQRGPPPQY